MLKIAALAVIALAGVSIAAHADDAETAAVRAALATLVPNAKPEAIEKSPLPGFYSIVLKGQVIYISADGKYLVQGDIFDIPNKESITGKALASMRHAGLKELPVDKRLVFAPANPKHTVVVFTDVDCPYCRQFHKQIAGYNQVGIAVQYVFFPLSIHPGADAKAVSVWCSQDRNAAYTAAMNGQDPGKKTCTNPIAETTALGLKIGIGGTPTILTADGVQVNGNAAADPQKLLAELDRIEKTPVAAATAANAPK
jgi:thiol:disulfide interchange protein DsbC